jgi:RNA polymerase sigma-70 factor (ECF subfamily)
MDAHCVRRAREGDRGAFEAIGREIIDHLHAVAYSILGDAQGAQDATQRALLTIWQDLPKLRDPDRFEAWSYRILVRSCYTEARRAPKWMPDDLLRTFADQRVEAELRSVVDRDQLERGFRRLTVEQRTVVVLHHLADMPLEQIAEVTGVPEGTVHSRLYRALRALRAALEADARDPDPTRRFGEVAR